MIKSFFLHVMKKIGLHERAILLNLRLKDKNGFNRNRFKDLIEFYKAFIKPGDLVFDIGANMGNRSFVFLELGAIVVAVEPNQKLYENLKFRFGEKVSILNIGLGEVISKMDFFIGSNHLVSSFSNEYIDHKTHLHPNLTYQKKVSVDVRTLDSLIAEYGMPSFIKIDVEGFEKQVIKGLSQKANLISFELNTPRFNIDAIESLVHLRQLGYSNCNYSFYENNKLEYDSWIGVEQLIDEIRNKKEFQSAAYLDIYIK